MEQGARRRRARRRREACDRGSGARVVGCPRPRDARRRAPRHGRSAMTGGAPQTVAAAYSAGGVAWAGAPSRIYSRLAELLVASCPVSLDGLTTLDVGAGTGVASRAAQQRG